MNKKLRTAYITVKDSDPTPHIDNSLKTAEKSCTSCKTVLPFLSFAKNKSNKDGLQSNCHTSEVIRGLLCTSCNNGLGRFKDNPKSLSKAIEYLKGTLHD